MKTQLIKFIAVFGLCMCVGFSEQARAWYNGIPIVFVHGATAENNPNNFISIRTSLLNAGFPASRIFMFNYTSMNCVEGNAAALRDYINWIRSSTGATKVNIVAHSLGTIVSRFAIRHFLNPDVINQYIGVAGPQHGTMHPLIYASWYCSPPQVAPWSPLLYSINSVDETWGYNTRYITLVGTYDDLILPFSSAYLNRGPTGPTPENYYLNNDVICPNAQCSGGQQRVSHMNVLDAQSAINFIHWTLRYR